jgi:broad specificity phosphatase PhoE
MFAPCPVLLVVPHADAGDRTKWTDDQDLRPLSDLGRRQAGELAVEVGRVDAVFSSPARRCTETVAPIAAISGVDIVEMDDLRELTYVHDHRPWDPWDPTPPMSDYLLAAAGLGHITRAVATIAAHRPTGVVAVCAHGDLVPLFAAWAAAHLDVMLPHPIARGGCWEIDLGVGRVRGRGALMPNP